MGGKNSPRSGSGHELVQRCAPSASPAAARSTIRSSCGARVDRADVGVLVQRVADAQRLDAGAQQLGELLGDRLLHQQPRPGAADVALVEEDPVDDAVDGLVERGVVVDDVGRLAAQLQREAAAGAGEAALDLLADVGGAGEGHLVQAAVPDDRRADVTGARQHVEDARRQPGVGGDLGEHQRCERGGLGGLEHDRVAARQRWGDLPRGHQQREVPRDHGADHPERARVRPEACVLQLVGPAGVVEQVRRRRGHVDVAGLPDRLAVVEGLQHGQLTGPLGHHPRDPVEVLGPLRARHRAPHLFVRAAGRGDGPVDVLACSPCRPRRAPPRSPG